MRRSRSSKKIWFHEYTWLPLLGLISLGCNGDQAALIEMRDRLESSIIHIESQAAPLPYNVRNHMMALASVQESLESGKSRPAIPIPYLCAVQPLEDRLKIELYWVRGDSDVDEVRFEANDDVATVSIANLDHRGWMKLQGLAIFQISQDASEASAHTNVVQIRGSTIDRISRSLPEGTVRVSLRTTNGAWTRSCIAMPY